MKKIKCMTCGNVQNDDFLYCQGCEELMNDENFSQDLKKMTRDEERLSEKLSEKQKKFVEGFSIGGFFAAALGGILFVFIYAKVSAKSRKINDWEWFSLVPILNFYVAYRLGKEGRRLAWAEARWSSYEEFFNKQKFADWFVPFSLIFTHVGLSLLRELL